MLLFIIFLLFAVPMIYGYWVCFEKAGHPGWAAIVPFYNLWILIQIIKKPNHWILLMIIPYLGIVWHIWALNLFVKKFGKSESFTVGCVFLPFIFFPLLAIQGQYVEGPSAAGDSRILDQNI